MTSGETYEQAKERTINWDQRVLIQAHKDPKAAGNLALTNILAQSLIFTRFIGLFSIIKSPPSFIYDSFVCLIFC